MLLGVSVGVYGYRVLLTHGVLLVDSLPTQRHTPFDALDNRQQKGAEELLPPG
jgi:hypothetical protein